MKKYMRDQFEYLGIKSPHFKVLMKEFLEAHGRPPISELDVILPRLVVTSATRISICRDQLVRQV